MSHKALRRFFGKTKKIAQSLTKLINKNREGRKMTPVVKHGQNSKYCRF